jgi:hypothetical protein
MLPAPASIAAAASPKSSPSCNPAVPPPPAGGAAVGISLVDEVAGAVTVSVTVTSGVVVGAGELTPGVPDAVVDVVAPEEALLPSEAGAVAVAVRVIVPEMVTDGVKVGMVGVEEDPLQAVTATGARRVRAPQHRTVSLARSAVPAVVVRTFMNPSSCARQMTTVFPGPGVRNVSRSWRQKPDTRKEKRVTDLVAARSAAGRSPKTPTIINVRSVTGGDVQWLVYHRNIRLTE